MTPEEINKMNKKEREMRKDNNNQKISLYCTTCKRPREIYSGTTRCPICKSLLNKFEDNEQQNIPKCPTCGSTNIKKISDLNRGVHALAFGFVSKTARSQFCCENCGYKW